jgi:hypothetical protein
MVNSDMNTTPKLDWNLFDLQEKEISTINNELHQLRKQKYPEYRDSYYRYYNEFGMRGMVGDLYRKFDRLKIMSENYSDEDIRSKEKEITDQFYDIISYCQLQLYWLRKEKWRKPHVQTLPWTISWTNTTDWNRVFTNKITRFDIPLSFIGSSMAICGPSDVLQNIDLVELSELITEKITEGLRR